jgi:hypothetical protein
MQSEEYYCLRKHMIERLLLRLFLHMAHTVMLLFWLAAMGLWRKSALRIADEGFAMPALFLAAGERLAHERLALLFYYACLRSPFCWRMKASLLLCIMHMICCGESDGWRRRLSGVCGDGYAAAKAATASVARKWRRKYGECWRRRRRRLLQRRRQRIAGMAAAARRLRPRGESGSGERRKRMSSKRYDGGRLLFDQRSDLYS